MGRSGYSDDYDHCNLWRAAVARSTHGARGQHFLRKLRDALDALPVKRLIADELVTSDGEVCALGAVDPVATVDAYDSDAVAAHFGIARALACEIVFMNDEFIRRETPEERYARMRRWVDEQIHPDEQSSDQEG